MSLVWAGMAEVRRELALQVKLSYLYGCSVPLQMSFDWQFTCLSQFPQVHTHASSSNILTLHLPILLILGFWPVKTFPVLMSLCEFLYCVTPLCTQMRRLETLHKTLSTGKILLGVYIMYILKSPHGSSGITVQFSPWCYMTGQSICIPSLNFFLLNQIVNKKPPWGHRWIVPKERYWCIDAIELCVMRDMACTHSANLCPWTFLNMNICATSILLWDEAKPTWLGGSNSTCS